MTVMTGFKGSYVCWMNPHHTSEHLSSGDDVETVLLFHHTSQHKLLSAKDAHVKYGPMMSKLHVMSLHTNCNT